MPPAPASLRARLNALYFGSSRRAMQFRLGLVGLDLFIVAVFLIASFVHDAWWIVPLDLLVAALLIAEFAARLYAADSWRTEFFSFATLADAVVLASLLLPAFIENLGFLRVLRAVVLLRSRHLRRDLRRHSTWFRTNEEIVQRTVTLGVFIFIVTSAVYVTQHRTNPAISHYIDALYFTITTLTTTGFGDITLQGLGGRVLAVIIMVVGVSLFLRLLKALVQPNKVRFECPDCGLMVHDLDAVHCKHCGRVLHIENEGFA